MTCSHMARMAMIAFAALALLAVPAQADWLVTAGNQIIDVSSTNGQHGQTATVPAGFSAMGVVYNPTTQNFYVSEFNGTNASQIERFSTSTFSSNAGPVALPGLGGGIPGGTNSGQGFGVALDAAGNVYVAITNANDRIQKLNAGLATSTPFRGNTSIGPTYVAVAVDAAGNVFATDNNTSSSQGEIRKYDSTGALVGTFGSSGVVPSLNQAIGGITIGADGNLYVANSAANTIHKFDSTTGADLGAFTSGNLTAPQGLAFGPDGNLYVANFGGGNIQEFNGTTGAFISTLSSGFSSGPRFISFSTPEPGSLSLVALGSVVGCLGYWRRRKSQAQEISETTATEQPEVV